MKTIRNATAHYYTPGNGLASHVLVIDLGPVGRWVLHRADDSFVGSVLRVSVDGMPDDASANTAHVGVIEVRADRPAGPTGSGSLVSKRYLGARMERLSDHNAEVYARATPKSLPDTVRPQWEEIEVIDV